MFFASQGGPQYGHSAFAAGIRFSFVVAMKRLFFSQSMLDTMVDAGKIRIDRNTLTMLAGNNPTFDLLPAYRFVKTFDNGPDPNGLVGLIKSEAELKELQAEIYMDSVIYKELAYQADPGYIAQQQMPQAAVAPTAARPAEQPVQAAAPAEAPAEKKADELSQFILDNLLGN